MHLKPNNKGNNAASVCQIAVVDDDASVRTANERLGGDPVGKQALRLLDERHHEAIYQWFDAIIAQPCGAMHEMSVEFEKAGPKRAKALNLPIRGKEGDVDTFIYLYSFWRPDSGEDQGQVLSAGRTYFKLQAIDVGAGVPENLPTF